MIGSTHPLPAVPTPALVEPMAVASTGQPLEARARLAALLALAAAALGLLADLLIRHGEPGAGFSLFVALFVVAVELLLRARGTGATGPQRFLLVVLLFFGESIAWRAAGSLALINLFAIFVALAALSPALHPGPVWPNLAPTLMQLVRSAFAIMRDALVGSVRYLEIDAGAGGWLRGRGGRAPAVLRGTALALPVIVAFTMLLVSADPVFEGLVRQVVDVNLEALAQHVLFASAFAWLAGGYLRGALLDDRRPATPAPAAGLSLGVTELSIVLGAVNVLFLSFVLVQVRYLFGGMAHVMATSHLTLAEYARRGFHELVFLALLVLPLLVAAHAVIERDNPRAVRVYRGLAGTLIGLLFLIMLSAAARLRLYMTEFGLTEDRVVALAIMIWLASAFVLFAATVLRGRPRWFGAGAVIAGWGVAAALNLADPVAIITRVNVQRGIAGQSFDASYVGTLGADAVPAALAAFASLPEADRCRLAVTLLRSASRAAPEDWRSWNRSRERAIRALSSHESRLGATRCEKDGAVTDAAHFDRVVGRPAGS